MGRRKIVVGNSPFGMICLWICSGSCRRCRDFHLDSRPGFSCMPSSSRGAAVTILVTKLTHKWQPGQVKEMNKMKKALVMTIWRYPKRHCSSSDFKNRSAGFSCM